MRQLKICDGMGIGIRSLMILFCLSFCELSKIFAQQRSVTQEEVELEYLSKYEAKTIPISPIPSVANEENEFLYGARLQRFMTLLESSDKDRRLPVSILIYGQSITGSQIFTDELRKYLKEKYPYALLDIKNRSIGGFGGEQLVRTAVHDGSAQHRQHVLQRNRQKLFLIVSCHERKPQENPRTRDADCQKRVQEGKGESADFPFFHDQIS